MVRYHKTTHGELKFDSMYHVALTRAEKMLYLVNCSFSDEESIISEWKNLHSKINVKKLFRVLQETYDLEEHYKSILDRFERKKDNKVVDYNYHISRSNILFAIFWLKMAEMAKNSDIAVRIKMIGKYKVKICDNVQEYYQYLKMQKNQKQFEIEKVIPLQKYYENIHEKFQEITIQIIEKSRTCSSEKFSEFILDCPENMIVFTYIFKLFLYKMVYIQDSYIALGQILNLDCSERVNFMKEIRKIPNVLSNIKSLSKNYKQSSSLKICYNQTEEFDIYNRLPISWSEKEIIFYIITPCINDFNIHEIYSEFILSTMLFSKISQDCKYYDEFKGKKVSCYFLTLYGCELVDVLEVDDLLNTIKTEIKDTYSIYHEKIFTDYNNSGNNFKKLTQEIDNKFKFPNYIANFFKYHINKKTKMEKEEFINTLDERLDSAIDITFE